MVVYPVFPASSGEAWWPGCLWPEQGAPAASVWEVQSPGLLLPPRAIRTRRSAPTPASFSLCPSSLPPYPRRAPRKSEMCQNVFVNIAHAVMALCIKSIKHIYLIYVYNWWLNICFRRVSLPVLISKPGTMADLNLVLSDCVFTDCRHFPCQVNYVDVLSGKGIILVQSHRAEYALQCSLGQQHTNLTVN